ncbi:uncharacterized protein [Triticum aestivum]|uniref:Uncharacterized protein n=1 Tax=Triticum turgidum subsp. durum TaxID=4567 RepID=A0A9R0X5T1_TRITD|nr:uncharacterized protein LOC123111432 [Triticum aestivum]VAI30500.1 unnamed protein product [Triticum turgidum subsp. durum]
MDSPTHIPAAAGSDSPPRPETCDKENIYQDRDIVSDCPMLHREGTVSTKRKKKPGGFNLRKSIAWNPAFFTEEGVLDNMELSVLSGSQMKANRSPGSGVGGIASPLCMFGRSGSSSVLKEVAENSHGKLLVKYRSAENKGRKLFSPAKTSECHEQRVLPGNQDKQSARSIQNSIPRSPAGYAQKKVPNSNATAQMTRTPKKSSQPSIPMVPRSTSSTANISKSNRNLPPVKVEHSSRVEALQLKSKIKPTPLTKSSGSTTEKDMVPLVTATHEEGSSSRNCSSFSTHSQNNPSSFVGVPASTFAKPSALRMPSPSIGFFSQGKALVSHDDAAQGNTSSLVRPPRYKQPEHLKSRLYQAFVLNGDTAQANAKICFTRNTSSLVKPPRYKQPEDLQSRHSLTPQLPTNCPAASKPLVHPVTNQSTLDTLVSSLPVLEHATVCSGKESLSKGAITCSAYSRNANNQPTRKVDCSSAGSGDTTPSSSSEKNGASRNGVLNAYSVASHVEEMGIINRTGPNKDSHSLRAICSSTTEHGEDSCSHEATGSSMNPIAVIRLSSSCISSQVCTLNDLNCQTKSDSSACLAIDLKNSLAGEKMVAVSLSEDNSCTPGPDFLREFDSRNQQNTECSTLRKSVESTTSADQVPQFGNPLDTEPASSDSTTDLHGSLCNEAELNSAEEPNTDGGAEFDSDSPPIGHELQLLIECDHDHDYRSTESSPIQVAAHMPCADFSDSKEVCKTETHDSLAVERRPALLDKPNTEDDMDLDSDSPLVGKEELIIGCESDHDYRSTECSPMEPAVPVPCIDLSDLEVTLDCKTETHDSLAVERRSSLLEEPNAEDDMDLDTNELSALDHASPIGKNKAAHKSGTNTILKDHLKQLVPFSEEWLAAMEACGEEVLEQKSGAVQNSPMDKSTPEPSPWSPVKRKAQDVGPFDCTKYSKSVRTSDTP